MTERSWMGDMDEDPAPLLIPPASVGLWRQRRMLRAFFRQPVRLGLPGMEGIWIGWGRKPSGRRAERLARRGGMRPLLLEDGFLRSFGLGVTGASPLSIVVDDMGAHYDATAPSRIEHMLQTADFTAGEIERAETVIRLLRELGLAKYNCGLPVPPDRFAGDDDRVLVVDQTRGDLSLRHGLVTDGTFAHMLQAALEENPGATVYIKTHPDVLAGKRQGCLPLRRDERIRYLTEDWHAHDLLAHFSKVYVATSLMGLEALVRGLAVRCFGMPFYAGWGLTHDEQICSRRTRKRTLPELVAAAYLRYARYRDPVTGKPCGIETVAHHIHRQMEAFRFWSRLRGEPWRKRVFAFGFRRWKQPQTRPFFGDGVQVRFVRHADQARRLGITAHDRIAVWGGRAPEDVVELARQLDLDIVHVEDGFLRSVGLGADFVPPLSLVFDARGIYFDPTRESDLERCLQHSVIDGEARDRARRLRERIVRHRLTKYNLCRPRTTPPPFSSQGRKVILVPGQVETDASIRLGSPVLRRNLDLLRKVREEEPEAFIVYRPHPDVAGLNRRGRVHAAKARELADHLATREDLLACLDWAEAVHTMTSLTGFDALLRGRRVVCHGLPFYAGWGLTEDRLSHPRRTAEPDLDTMVHCALVVYPRYRLPGIEGFVPPEAVIEHLAASRPERPPSLPVRLIGKTLRWILWTGRSFIPAD